MDLYLSSPLALEAGSGRDGGVASAEQRAEAVDLVVGVDIDAEVVVIVTREPAPWPWGRGGVACGGEWRRNGEEAGEEEGDADEEEGARLMGPRAGRVVRAPHRRRGGAQGPASSAALACEVECS